METRRLGAHAPLTEELGRRIATLRGPCVGCQGCTGLCAALIEALTLPEALLARGGRT